MPLDTDVALIEKWGRAGDRQTPEAAGLTRATGFPASYSALDGDTPEREVVQQLFAELTAAAVEWRAKGYAPWHAEVDYPAEEGRCQHGGKVWKAKVATGPATGNATAPAAGPIWEEVTGTLAPAAVPDAPNAPTGTAGNGEIEWSWNCPRDNGAVITGFDFRTRRQGTGEAGWSAPARVTPPHTPTTGLQNGVVYEAQVRAVNSEGASAWSAVGNATPVAAVPDRVQQLIVEPSDRALRVRFSTPDDNGSAITRFEVQHKSGAQNWSSTRQVSVTSSPATISPLVNGTAYDVRVRAVNARGNGEWSPVVRTTPGAGEQRYTAAGRYNFTWPWAATKARVVVIGGGGGGGGGAPDGRPGVGGPSGSAGSPSSVTGNGVTRTARGGNAGVGGGTRVAVAHAGGVRTRQAVGNGGDGGRSVRRDNGQEFSVDYNGESGFAGEVVIAELTGLSVGARLAVVVGAGGARGNPTDPGAALSTVIPGAGSPGGPGSVTIVPLY